VELEVEKNSLPGAFITTRNQHSQSTSSRDLNTTNSKPKNKALMMIGGTPAVGARYTKATDMMKTSSNLVFPADQMGNDLPCGRTLELILPGPNPFVFPGYLVSPGATNPDRFLYLRPCSRQTRWDIVCLNYSFALSENGLFSIMGSVDLMNFAGTPPTNENGATSLVTAELGATTE